MVNLLEDTAYLIVFDGDKSAFLSAIYCGLPSTYAADEVCLMNVLRKRRRVQALPLDHGERPQGERSWSYYRKPFCTHRFFFYRGGKGRGIP